MSKDFRHNHYVPEWYQKRFLPPSGSEQKLAYLDLKPEKRISNGHVYTPAALRRRGTPSCFAEKDLYTTRVGSLTSTDIERFFFGKIDREGQAGIEYFGDFAHPSVDHDAVMRALVYLSVQKLRTPKGLLVLSEMIKAQGRNNSLLEMQRLRNMFCAVWTEAAWAIVGADRSKVKFLLSDHPVTVYNHACPPGSIQCRGARDPDVRMTGTHTLFPLSADRLLILTNVSWLRNPYTNPTLLRPNPSLFRQTFFNFLQIQTGRYLSEVEVCEINYIIKARAFRYIAAAQEEWLYPERMLRSLKWHALGGGYLLFPDPRSVKFSSGVRMGYASGATAAFDEYGRGPDHPHFDEAQARALEWRTHLAFQGEYARVFGPDRKGIAYEVGGRQESTDDADFHNYHLRLEGKYKPKVHSSIRRTRPKNAN
jgi:hypothetical protein